MRDSRVRFGHHRVVSGGLAARHCAVTALLSACCAVSDPSLELPSPAPPAQIRCARGGDADTNSRDYRSCLESACQDSHGAACARLADIYRAGEELPRDAALAALLYRRACDGGDVGGCHHLANMYFVGDGVPQEHERAITIYDELCDRGFPTVCQVVGYLFETGQGGLGRDAERAAHYYGLACDGGFQEGCKRLRRIQRQK